jgi:hypothetical protein
MGLFNRNTVNSDEYIELHKHLMKLETTINALLLDQETLRNKVLRKINTQSPNPQTVEPLIKPVASTPIQKHFERFNNGN